MTNAHRGRFAGVSRRDADQGESARANKGWWDAEAGDYYAEHGAFLGDADLVWGPEGLRESDARILGPAEALVGLRVLEVGGGAAQGGRWLAEQGAVVVSTDLSTGMLAQARSIDARRADGIRAGNVDAGSSVGTVGAALPLLACDAAALPFADASFDLVMTAYGAVPFVADSAAVMREAARVLRRGGRFVFSTTHPVRWAFPDVPGEAGLTATSSYFDRSPYVEEDDQGRALYVEHHRTLGDRVREITAAGLRLVDLVEPEWPAGHDQVWGGWSPLRGRLIPGSAIYVCERPA
ncbi:class I SAM-dependent methyltransferase [Arsenicicoccus sp. oral taxon 190]|uniref:class I SAM-dependent methyltransferase n=1 Tax=Arsenicicoccus sp. oral taxon 190 TaxID=1658671 RepID=UPI00067A22DD|nr:class I SAM-dependent methyltransferase [Arsenicicoccus sp. oral taxon 190]AKT51754.1 SAM-dependent methyltransferase [Arsenicicoccus sp. oral taxon 190]